MGGVSFRETQNEDDRGLLSIQSSLVSTIKKGDYGVNRVKKYTPGGQHILRDSPDKGRISLEVSDDL
jgi:hypothetical protein